MCIDDDTSSELCTRLVAAGSGLIVFHKLYFGLDGGPSDGGGCKVPGLCSHAMPLGGHTQPLFVSVPAKRQQLASSCWYLLLATSQATWTAVHEAHNHLDARAGCGRGQWSGGARPC